MGTQETAKVNINVVLSNDMRAGELPGDQELEEIIMYRLNNRVDTLPKMDCLAVEVIFRTGELE